MKKIEILSLAVMAITAALMADHVISTDRAYWALIINKKRFKDSKLDLTYSRLLRNLAPSFSWGRRSGTVFPIKTKFTLNVFVSKLLEAVCKQNKEIKWFELLFDSLEMTYSKWAEKVLKL